MSDGPRDHRKDARSTGEPEVSVLRRPISRRLLFAAGAVELVAGCSGNHGASSAPATTQTATASGLPPPPTTAPTTALVTPGPSATLIPQPNIPVAGVCPRAADVQHKAGNPIQYLGCVGTNIALTIDDGPDRTWTPQVLALLRRYGIKATFCMIGASAKAHPSLVRAVAADGHEIANHTQTHPLNLYRMNPGQVRTEVAAAADSISQAAGGQRPQLFRAPGGAWSKAILAECAAEGLRPLDWSVDPRDWSKPGVEHIVDVLLTKTHPGSILLDHDGGGNRHQTVDALTIVLPRLLDAGYQFVKV